MKVKVRMFGTLGNQFPDHDPLNGFEVEIPDDASVGELLDQLQLPKSKIGLVSVQGHLVKATKILKPGDFVRIFRPIFGG
jgi:sulfur carrier protein ThiS